MTDESERERVAAWNQCAGRRQALIDVVDRLAEKAGHEYVNGREDAARLLREEVRFFQLQLDRATRELEGHINATADDRARAAERKAGR